VHQSIDCTAGPLHAHEEAVPLGIEAAWNGGGLHREARGHRYAVITALLAVRRAISRRAGDFAAALERWHQARTTRRALQDLDDRLLRDLGFTRSEIGSVAAEIAGSAVRTRSLVHLRRAAQTKTPAQAGVSRRRPEQATRSA